MLPVSPKVIEFNNSIPGKLPEEILELIHSMNDYSPRIYPPFQGCGVKRGYYNDYLDSSYATLNLALKGKKYDGIIVIPRIRTGGTDKLLKSYLTAMKEGDFDILIICEESSESIWTPLIENLAEVIYLDRVFSKKPPTNYALAAIYANVIDIQPKFIWSFNSRLAYQLFCTYGNALCKITNFWLVSFAHWIHEVSYREFGMIHDYLPHCKDYLTYIISDNSIFTETLKRQYNLPANILKHVPSPNSVSDIEYQPRAKRSSLKILWASGVEWNKGIDLLPKIAEGIKELDVSVQIEVYGTPKNDAGYELLETFESQIEPLDNISYKGTFNNFNSLMLADYDIFLFTSMIEGMPNILLEAVENQLFIISSDVGGITDLVTDSVTGLLVADSFDVVQYVKKIEEVSQMADETYNQIRRQMVEHYNSKYTIKHARANFNHLINDSGMEISHQKQ